MFPLFLSFSFSYKIRNEQLKQEEDEPILKKVKENETKEKKMKGPYRQRISYIHLVCMYSVSVLSISLLLLLLPHHSMPPPSSQETIYMEIYGSPVSFFVDRQPEALCLSPSLKKKFPKFPFTCKSNHWSAVLSFSLVRHTYKSLSLRQSIHRASK